MPGELDQDLRDVARDLVDRLGKEVLLQRVFTAPNPGTGGTTNVIEKEVKRTATPPRDFTQARIAGTLIEAGDTVIQVPALGLDMGKPEEPRQGDQVVMDGETWSVVQVGRVYSGHLVVLFTLQLRR